MSGTTLAPDFTWFTDIHDTRVDWLEGEESAVMAEIDAAGGAFIVASGDQMDDVAGEDNYNSYETLVSGLTKPLYTLRGNHDGDYWLEHFVINQGDFQIIAFHVDLVFVDPPQDNTATLSEAEIEWIETQLQSYTGTKILMCHQPLSTSLWGYIDEDAQAAIASLASTYGVKAYFSGHVHIANDTMPLTVGDITEVNGTALIRRSDGGFMTCYVFGDRILINIFRATTPFDFIRQLTVPL
jgi:3',5'-cyclic AMP phosphodiesterase CpdA